MACSEVSARVRHLAKARPSGIVLECSEIRLKYRVPTTLKLRRESENRTWTYGEFDSERRDVQHECLWLTLGLILSLVYYGLRGLLLLGLQARSARRFDGP